MYLQHGRSFHGNICLCSCGMPCVIGALQDAELQCSDKVCAERPEPDEMCALKKPVEDGPAH